MDRIWVFSSASNGVGGYAAAETMVDGKRTHIKMHRLIIDAPEGVEIDHVDRNGLNNRKENYGEFASTNESEGLYG